MIPSIWIDIEETTRLKFKYLKPDIAPLEYWEEKPKGRDCRGKFNYCTFALCYLSPANASQNPDLSIDAGETILTIGQRSTWNDSEHTLVLLCFCPNKSENLPEEVHASVLYNFRVAHDSEVV